MHYVSKHQSICASSLKNGDIPDALNLHEVFAVKETQPKPCMPLLPFTVMEGVINPPNNSLWKNNY